MMGSAEYAGLPDTNPQPVSVFLDRAYRELLNRPLDQAGLTYWSGQMAQGSTGDDVINGITGSTEFQTLQINELYQSLLGRQADPEGLKSWLNFLASGGTLGQIQSFIVGSSEFQNARLGLAGK
jgi:hypothetical protein